MTANHLPGTLSFRNLTQSSGPIEVLSDVFAGFYLRAFETGQEWHAGLSRHIEHFNFSRLRSSVDGRSPDEVDRQNAPPAEGGCAALNPASSRSTRYIELPRSPLPLPPASGILRHQDQAGSGWHHGRDHHGD